jgi:hypothetical protein
LLQKHHQLLKLRQWILSSILRLRSVSLNKLLLWLRLGRSKVIIVRDGCLRFKLLFTQASHGGWLLHHTCKLSLGVIPYSLLSLDVITAISVRWLLRRHATELSVLLIRKCIVVILLSGVHFHRLFKIQIKLIILLGCPDL